MIKLLNKYIGAKDLAKLIASYLIGIYLPKSKLSHCINYLDEENTYMPAISILGSNVYLIQIYYHEYYSLINITSCIKEYNAWDTCYVCYNCSFLDRDNNIYVIGLTKKYFIVKTDDGHILIENRTTTKKFLGCSKHILKCEKNCEVTFYNNKEKTAITDVEKIYNDGKYLFLANNKNTFIIDNKLNIIYHLPYETFGCLNWGILLSNIYTVGRDITITDRKIDIFNNKKQIDLHNYKIIDARYILNYHHAIKKKKPIYYQNLITYYSQDYGTSHDTRIKYIQVIKININKLKWFT